MIKVCTFSKYYDEITDFLNSNNLEFSSDECLLRCDLCHTVPFVKIDKSFISDENIEVLFEKIKTSVQ